MRNRVSLNRDKTMTIQEIFIHRDTPTANFTPLSNEILQNKKLSLELKGLIAYILSLPKTWQFKPKIAYKQLGLSLNKLYGLLAQLRDLGYAVLKKFADGRTEWFFFANPKTKNPETEKPEQAIWDTYKRNKEQQNKETPQTPTATIADFLPVTEPVCGGDFEEEIIEAVVEQPEPVIELPEQLTEPEKKQAAKIIKTAPVKHQAAIVAVLKQALKEKQINSPVGYLTSLVTRANNGTFEALKAAQAAPTFEQLEAKRKSKEEHQQRLCELARQRADKTGQGAQIEKPVNVADKIKMLRGAF